MPDFPETRASLVARVKDPRDAEAWSRFVAVYHPVIYRLARNRGMQDADAEDLAQQVLASVATAVKRWEPDPNRGRFRTWLTRITRNAVTNALARARPDRGDGGTDSLALLEQQPNVDTAADEDLERESRRAVFRWAQEKIQPEFQPSTWAAFQRTTVEGQNIEQAAEALGKTPGAIYAARSRVMRRLKETVRQYDDD